MKAIINGTLVSVKANYPDKTKKQDFAPNQTLNFMQISESGDAEIIGIKCDDMSANFNSMIGKNLQFECRLFQWQNGSKSGLSVKFVSAVPVEKTPSVSVEKVNK